MAYIEKKKTALLQGFSLLEVQAFGDYFAKQTILKKIPPKSSLSMCMSTTHIVTNQKYHCRLKFIFAILLKR